MSRQYLKNAYNDVILERLIKRMSISGQELTLDEFQNLVDVRLDEILKVTRNPKGTTTKKLVTALDTGLQVIGFVDRALAFPKSAPVKIKISGDQSGFGRITDDDDEDSSEESEDSNDCRDGCNCTSCCIHCMRNLITQEQAKFCSRVVISDGEIKFTGTIPVEVQQHRIRLEDINKLGAWATKQKELKLTKPIFAKRK